MTEETTKYQLTPNQLETPNLKFCPFVAAAVPEPLGKLTFLRPPCDPHHCGLGDPDTGQCSLWQIQDRLVWLAPIASSLKDLTPLYDRK
jgi:hypothetical protein